MTKMVLGRVAALMSACVLGGNVSGTGISALVLNETVQTETVASPVAMSDAKSEYVARTAAALNQTASVAFAVAANPLHQRNPLIPQWYVSASVKSIL